MSIFRREPTARRVLERTDLLLQKLDELEQKMDEVRELIEDDQDGA